MKCDNIFCVYWEDNECTLESISLDIQGKCESCIYLDVDREVLNKMRKKQMKNSFAEDKGDL